MTSPRWSTLFSGLVLVLSLARRRRRGPIWLRGHGGARLGRPVRRAYGNGIGYGFSPYGYGSYGVGYGGFGSFPMPGFAEALGVIPQTTIALPGLSYGVTAVPGWDGPGRSVARQRVRRRR